MKFVFGDGIEMIFGVLEIGEYRKFVYGYFENGRKNDNSRGEF